MTLPTDYAIAAGWNAADGSLVTIPTLLSAYLLPYIGVTITARAGLVNTLPIRSSPLNGAERGDGMVNGLGWGFGGMPIAAFRYWVSTFSSSGTVTSAPVTICTARYDLSAIWVKANAYWILPVPGVDYSYDSQNVISFNQRFSDYVAL